MKRPNDWEIIFGHSSPYKSKVWSDTHATIGQIISGEKSPKVKSPNEKILHSRNPKSPLNFGIILA